MAEHDLTLVLERFGPLLGPAGKGRLQSALKAFRPDPPPPPAAYYLEPLQQPDDLLQADLLASIRVPFWDEATATYRKLYVPALLLSNSCDVTANNRVRGVEKQAVFAALTDARTYFQLIRQRHATGGNGFIDGIMRQEATHLLYLPPPPVLAVRHPDGFIVELDRLSWFPASELQQVQPVIVAQRLASLSQWAHYLFLVKLAHHLCRPPEEPDRPRFE